MSFCLTRTKYVHTGRGGCRLPSGEYWVVLLMEQGMKMYVCTCMYSVSVRTMFSGGACPSMFSGGACPSLHATGRGIYEHRYFVISVSTSYGDQPLQMFAKRYGIVGFLYIHQTARRPPPPPPGSLGALHHAIIIKLNVNNAIYLDRLDHHTLEVDR